MLLLAIDTSTTSGSIALLENSRLIAERTMGNVGTHAGWLMRAVSSLLEDSGTQIDRVDRFAIGVGPGSFTGLRIGISAVKGLAWSLGKDVIGVSTLKALAMNARYSGAYVCPVLDARKKEVYSAIYGFDGGEIKTVLDESALAPTKLFEHISRFVAGPMVFLGSGLEVYADLIRENVKDAIIAPEPLWQVRASNIGLLALDNIDGAQSPESLTPVYLRKSEAEIKSGR